jgi:hypothetical protein
MGLATATPASVGSTETAATSMAVMPHPLDQEYAQGMQEEMKELRLRNRQLEHESSFVRAELNRALAVAEIQVIHALKLLMYEVLLCERTQFEGQD